MRTLLLPGLDGTGRLFSAFVPELPASIGAEVVSYPSDLALSYADLLARLPLRGEPVQIIAESFSGPLAIRAAAAHAEVRALVLVASFAKCPVSWLHRVLGTATPAALFRRPPPRYVVRRYLLGDDAPEDDVAQLQTVVGEVAPAVIATRLREICMVDVEKDFGRLTIPVLYLAGSRDRLVDQRVAHQLLRLRPVMELETVDAPHLVLQRRPLEAAKRIAAFFETHLRE